MSNDSVPSLFQSQGRRVLICVRGNCAHPDQGEHLYKRLTRLIRQHGLDDPGHPQHVTAVTVYCLGVCRDGPIISIQPEGLRYSQVDDAAVDRIFREHLLKAS